MPHISFRGEVQDLGQGYSDKSKDVPWKVKCRRLVDHVCAVVAFESEYWSWTVLTVDKISGTPRHCYGYSASKDTKKRHASTIVQKTCNMARKIWIQMGLLFVYEVIADRKWCALGWACDEKSNAVIDTLTKVYRWRSTRWWHCLQTKMMERDPENHTR